MVLSLSDQARRVARELPPCGLRQEVLDAFVEVRPLRRQQRGQLFRHGLSHQPARFLEVHSLPFLVPVNSVRYRVVSAMPNLWGIVFWIP